MYKSDGTDAILDGDSCGTVYIKTSSGNLIHGIVSTRVKPTEGEVASVMYSSPIAYATNAGFTVKTN